MNRRTLSFLVSALAVLIAIGGQKLGRALASGIPTNTPLVYNGTLVNNGVPMTGSPLITLEVTDGGNAVCATTANHYDLSTTGAFSAALDPSCVAAVHAYPNLFVDINVNGTDLGPVPLSAVPYAVEAGNGVPPGTVIAYAGPVSSTGTGAPLPPVGWLVCDGTAKAPSAYPVLFQAIGYSAGGSGATFNLPDYRGRFLRGLDQSGSTNDPDGQQRTALAAGGNSGDQVSTFQAGDIQSHNHPVNDPGHVHAPSQGTFLNGNCGTKSITNGVPGLANGASFVNINGNDDTATALTGITVQDAGGAETRPANVAVNYLIKY